MVKEMTESQKVAALQAYRNSLMDQSEADDLPFGVEPVTYGEDIEDDYDDMEDLDPTQFMEEITEEVDTALEMDVDVALAVSAEGEDMEEVGLVDHIEIEEPPETEEIAGETNEDLVEPEPEPPETEEIAGETNEDLVE